MSAARQAAAHWILVSALCAAGAAIGALGLAVAPRVTLVLWTLAAAALVAAGVAMHRYPGGDR